MALAKDHDEMTKLMDESFEVENKPFFNRYYFFEVVMLLIFPWPGFEHLLFMEQLAPAAVAHVVYFWSDLMIIFMFFRFYAVTRHIERYHPYTDAYCRKICQSKFNFDPNGLFCLKIDMVSNPTRVASILFFTSIIMLAQILRIFELPYEMNNSVNSVDLRDFGSAIWLIIITSTTVGYGDIYPHTIGGQFVCVITAFWGTFIVSLLVLVVANVFELSDDEKKAIAFIKQSRSAATSIGRAFKFYLLKKKFYVHKMVIDDSFHIHSSTFLTKVLENAKENDNNEAGNLNHAVLAHNDKEESKKGKMIDLFKANFKKAVVD